MIKRIILFGVIANTNPVISQNSYFTHKIDTIRLKNIGFKKPLLYEYGTVWFLVEFEKFQELVRENIDDYYEILYPAGGNKAVDRKKIKKSIKKLQSLQKGLSKQLNFKDSIIVHQISLTDEHSPMRELPWFFAKEIDSANCMIRQKNNNWQYDIIRDKGPWGSFRGGRKYYFPGNSSSFIDIMDWER